MFLGVVAHDVGNAPGRRHLVLRLSQPYSNLQLARFMIVALRCGVSIAPKGQMYPDQAMSVSAGHLSVGRAVGPADDLADLTNVVQ
jgi:hypothetical protein